LFKLRRETLPFEFLDKQVRELISQCGKTDDPRKKNDAEQV